MNINKKLCPAGLKNNPNCNLKGINYITVHCTGNYSATASAKGHADYLYEGSGGGQMSWHYTVDAQEIWQSFNDNQACWHAGDGGGAGNMQSIGIEICVHDRNGFAQACDNAAGLTASLLKKYNLTIDKVVQHNKWSGKDCPHELRTGEWGVTWSHFTDKVKKLLAPSEPVVSDYEKNIDMMFAAGVIRTPEYWRKINIPYLNELLENAAGKVERSVNNNVTDFQTALDILSKAGIMNTPEYWRNLSRTTEYLSELIINMANKCKITV